MKQEKTYIFIEEFLKWNFDELPSSTKEMLYGSPSFALHLWLGLMKIHVPCGISIVLFEDAHDSDKDAVEDFIHTKDYNIQDVPTHFVISIRDNESIYVHFDSRGDLTSSDKRIKSIHPLGVQRISKLTRGNKVGKILHGAMLADLKTVMSRMDKMHTNWAQGSKNDHWDNFDPYHTLLFPQGKWKCRRKVKQITK